mgnify:CR=1 FL=1
MFYYWIVIKFEIWLNCRTQMLFWRFEWISWEFIGVNVVSPGESWTGDQPNLWVHPGWVGSSHSLFRIRWHSVNLENTVTISCKSLLNSSLRLPIISLPGPKAKYVTRGVIFEFIVTSNNKHDPWFLNRFINPLLARFDQLADEIWVLEPRW